MKLLSLFLIITFQTIIFTWAGYIQDKLFNTKTVKVVRLNQCSGTNLPLQHFIQLGKCDGRSAFVTNITLLVKENLKNKLKLTVSINRCRSRENLDSCEEYHQMRNLDFCQAISPDILLPGVSNPLLAIPFEPIVKCPIKQGTYHAYNFTFNLAPFILFNLDGWYWKLKSELFSSQENNKCLDKRIWKINGIGPCRGTNLPFQLHIQGAQVSPTLAYLPNVTVIAKANLTEETRFVLTITRCLSRENLDTCEEFYKMDNMDICQAINPDTILRKTNPLVLPFEPTFKCPVKKGIYHASNVTIDMTPLVFFDIADWYWKTTGKLFLRNKNTLLSCSYVEGQLIPNRV